MVKAAFILIILTVSLFISLYIIINSLKGIEKIKKLESELYYYEDNM